MIILGLDPGIALTGYGVISVQGNSYRVLAYDAIETPSRLAHPLRLKLLFDELKSLCHKYQPREAAIEQLFFSRNASTAFTVGQARGVALLAVAEAGAEVFEYTPLQVKSTITGSGRASKQQVQFMVRALLGLPAIPKPDDIADALAIAICHCHLRGSVLK
ncbi:MAG: crossover junction endodeoxyribonuclease RuvC [Bacillota bacterium]